MCSTNTMEGPNDEIHASLQYCSQIQQKITLLFQTTLGPGKLLCSHAFSTDESIFYFLSALELHQANRLFYSSLQKKMKQYCFAEKEDPNQQLVLAIYYQIPLRPGQMLIPVIFLVKHLQYSLKAPSFVILYFHSFVILHFHQSFHFHIEPISKTMNIFLANRC